MQKLESLTGGITSSLASDKNATNCTVDIEADLYGLQYSRSTTKALHWGMCNRRHRLKLPIRWICNNVYRLKLLIGKRLHAQLFVQFVKIFPTFSNPKRTSPCPQKPAIGTSSEPLQYSQTIYLGAYIILSYVSPNLWVCSLFPSGFPIRHQYLSLCPTRVSYPARPTVLRSVAPTTAYDGTAVHRYNL